MMIVRVFSSVPHTDSELLFVLLGTRGAAADSELMGGRACGAGDAVVDEAVSSGVDLERMTGSFCMWVMYECS